MEDSGEEEDEKDKDRAKGKVVEVEKGRILCGFQRGSWWSRGDDWTSRPNVLTGTGRRILGVIWKERR